MSASAEWAWGHWLLGTGGIAVALQRDPQLRFYHLNAGKPEMSSYTVHARWDPASATWWTDGEDIPGLTCQAGSFEELVDVIFELGPELLRDNGIEPLGQSVEISVVAERRATARIAV